MLVQWVISKFEYIHALDTLKAKLTKLSFFLAGLSSNTLVVKRIFNILIAWYQKCEKSVGTTELHYSTKKRKHSFGILKAFFVRHSSEYETSDNDRKVNRNI